MELDNRGDRRTLGCADTNTKRHQGGIQDARRVGGLEPRCCINPGDYAIATSAPLLAYCYSNPRHASSSKQYKGNGTQMPTLGGNNKGSKYKYQHPSRQFTPIDLAVGTPQITHSRALQSRLAATESCTTKAKAVEENDGKEI